MSETAAQEPFFWLPAHGPDPVALERMARQFPKPSKPMGEAWFMSPVRQMYPELLGDLEDLTDEQLERPMTEMAIGPTSFGQLPEWTEWYHYLLPRLIERRWRTILNDPVELLLTGFVAQHPSSAGDWPYPQFVTDALATLGQYIMKPSFWPDREAVPQCFNKWQGRNGVCGWYRADGLLSASLFFCAKYLSADLVGPWFTSVAAIPNKYWQAQLITWLVGAHSMLTGQIAQPSEFPEDGTFGVGWEWSHSLAGNYCGDHQSQIETIPFLPATNRAAILDVARKMDTNEFFHDLLTDPHLTAVAAETAGLREDFAQYYVTAH